MPVLRITDLDLSAKRVLIREDLNVPLKNGVITDDTRIRAALPNIQYALAQNARVMIVSHLGRPKEGIFNPEDSLQPVAQRLSELLGREIKLVNDWIDQEDLAPAPGEVILLENVRCLVGEKKNNPELAQKMAQHCDIYVMDAFGTAHRAEVSTCGIASFAPLSCAGLLLAAELDALGKALEQPAPPMVAIVGGSKVSTKLTVLNSLADKVDHLIVGGGIANTFLLAQGHAIGQSLAETELVEEARHIIAKIQAKGGQVPLPVDVVCAKSFSESADAIVKTLDEIEADDQILDIGPESAKKLAALLQEAGTIVWNGPVGVFEWDQFGEGTRIVSEAIADSPAFSIAGGGDTLAAVSKYHITDKVSYISTGGGAFLEFLEGKKLPAVAALEAAYKA